MASRNSKKLALSVLGLGAATAAVVFGSWATWTAQTTNPGNTVTAGSLTMYDSKGTGVGNPILTTNVSNIKPGDSSSDTVTIRNDSTIDFSSVNLTVENVTVGTGFTNDTQNTLGVKIHDDTTNRCIFPTDASGACGSYGAWTSGGVGSVSNFAIKDSGGTTDVWTKDPDGAGAGLGEAHTYTVAWQFSNGASADNDSQGATASFDVKWDGVL